jgi:hypothetical protein
MVCNSATLFILLSCNTPPPLPQGPFHNSGNEEMDPSQIQYETPGYDYVGVGSVRRASSNTRLASGFNETRKEL